MVCITIDCREPKLYESFSSLLAGHAASAAISCKSDQLLVGDVLVCHNEVPVFIIERKSLTDLAASIVDKRFKEQKSRMMSFMNHQSHRVIYIIETGSITVSDLNPDSVIGLTGVKCSAIQTVIIEMQVIQGHSVFLVKDTYQTAQTIYKMVSRLLAHPERWGSNNEPGNEQQTSEYHSLVRVKKADNINKDPFILAVLQLSVIPGISSEAAKTILQHFQVKSLKDLFTRINTDIQSESNLLNEVSNLKCNGHKRKLGKSVAKSFLTMLGYA